MLAQEETKRALECEREQTRREVEIKRQEMEVKRLETEVKRQETEIDKMKVLADLLREGKITFEQFKGLLEAAI